MAIRRSARASGADASGGYRKDETELMAKTTRKAGTASAPATRNTKKTGASASAGADTKAARPASPVGKTAARRTAAVRTATPGTATVRKTAVQKTAKARATASDRPTAAEPIIAEDRVMADQRPTAAEPTHDEIALRAYHIYLRREGRSGDPAEDWRRAVQELRAERMIFVNF
jgi:hypothetical protein